MSEGTAEEVVLVPPTTVGGRWTVARTTREEMIIFPTGAQATAFAETARAEGWSVAFHRHVKPGMTPGLSRLLQTLPGAEETVGNMEGKPSARAVALLAGATVPLLKDWTLRMVGEGRFRLRGPVERETSLGDGDSLRLGDYQVRVTGPADFELTTSDVLALAQGEGDVPGAPPLRALKQAAKVLSGAFLDEAGRRRAW